MRTSLFAATAAAVIAMNSVASADLAGNPTNNGNQAVDCGTLFTDQTFDQPKNIGQAQRVIINPVNDEHFGEENNLAQHGMDLEADVGEFMQLNISICGIGGEPS